jgi:hypothetical protein
VIDAIEVPVGIGKSTHPSIVATNPAGNGLSTGTDAPSRPAWLISGTRSHAVIATPD